MAPLTFTDTHNMVAFLSKSDVSEGFDQIVYFLNAHTIQYALVVNPTIYVSCIKQFCPTATIKKVNVVVQLRSLIDDKKVVVLEDVIRRDIHLDDADGCVSTKRTAWNEFSCSMASAVICLATAVEEEKANMPIASAPPSPINDPSPPPHDPTLTPHATPPTLPPQEQPTTTFESSMSLLTTLMETCATLSKKVTELEQDKHTQALEILKLNKRVKKLEKKKNSKSSGFKRLRRVGTSKRVESSTHTVGRINQEEVNAASKGVSAAEPTVFDDEEVTMNMAQTLIKKNQSLKKKLVSIAQAMKNMIIYLKNMVRYKMEHFRWMTYDKVKPIFEREYKKVQTLFKPDKDVEEPKKKRVTDETLLQESFKNLRAAEVLVPSVDMEKALWVELKRLFEPNAYDVSWKLQRYMHAPLTWKLYTDCKVHHVSSTRGYDIFMLTEKDYPLSNGVVILMLSEKLQVKEDNEMARDLVMKIFIVANRPKSRSLDTSSK
nr:hypothetical protein [Tanacetum cinerariifolium]